MTTRLGVTKDSKIISAQSRLGFDNKNYYDFEFVIQSFASREQLSTTQSLGLQELEWDRILFTTLGIANGRLYALRIQTGENNLYTSKATIKSIQDSFECPEIL